MSIRTQLPKGKGMKNIPSMTTNSKPFSKLETTADKHSRSESLHVQEHLSGRWADVISFPLPSHCDRPQRMGFSNLFLLA